MKLWKSRFNPQCKLSQQGLLDISEEITQSYAPHETHYHPELVLMPVDPVNLYAYWNLKESSAENIIEHVDKQLALRIYSLPEHSNNPGAFTLSFDIKVEGFRNQQQVHLPIAATAYSAVIGEINADDSFSALATSGTIHVPRENPIPEGTLINTEHAIISEKIQDEAPITEEHHLHENRAFENSESSENTAPLDSVQEDHFVAGKTSPYSEPEVITLKNYNDYGYDLKVYKHPFDSETTPDLSQSELAKLTINTHKHIDINQFDSNKPDTNKPNSKNFSGLGRQS